MSNGEDSTCDKHAGTRRTCCRGLASSEIERFKAVTAPAHRAAGLSGAICDDCPSVHRLSLERELAEANERCKAWHQATMTAGTILGLPGGLGALEFAQAVQDHVQALASSSAAPTREARLAEALKLVLDDWANANAIGDDAREQAERALNAPVSSELARFTGDDQLLADLDSAFITDDLAPQALKDLCRLASVALADANYWRARHCRESEAAGKQSHEHWQKWKDAEARLAAVSHERSNDRDAARYRWLSWNAKSYQRIAGKITTRWHVDFDGSQPNLDAAIDEAMGTPIAASATRRSE